MSDRPSLRLFDFGRMSLIATSLVGSLAFGGGSFVASAQDATPGASPAGNCVPGEPSMDMGTPADMATPAAGEEPAGTPADDATIAAANAFVDNAKACAGDAAGLATLVTPNLVKELGGYDSIDAATKDGFFEDAPFGNATTGDVTSYDDGSVGIVVNYQQTEYQYVSEEWLLVQEMDAWKLNGIHGGLPINMDGDSAAVGMNLVENADGTYAITPNATSVVATDILILQGVSAATNKEPHMLVILQVPEGKVAADVVSGSVAEEDTTFIGAIDGIMPGDSTDMYLVNLPAGKYVVACFVGGPDGKPHAFNGMIVDFEVTAPAT
jgi:hypothetical protein